MEEGRPREALQFVQGHTASTEAGFAASSTEGSQPPLAQASSLFLFTCCLFNQETGPRSTQSPEPWTGPTEASAPAHLLCARLGTGAHRSMWALRRGLTSPPSETRSRGPGGPGAEAGCLGPLLPKRHSFTHTGCAPGSEDPTQGWLGPEPLTPELLRFLLCQKPWQGSSAGPLSLSPEGVGMTQFLPPPPPQTGPPTPPTH